MSELPSLLCEPCRSVAKTYASGTAPALVSAKVASVRASIRSCRVELCNITGDTIRPDEDVPVFRTRLLQTPKGFVDARYIQRNGAMLDVKLHYHRFQCLMDSGDRVDARLVIVEFWRDSEGKGT